MTFSLWIIPTSHHAALHKIYRRIMFKLKGNFNKLVTFVGWYSCLKHWMIHNTLNVALYSKTTCLVRPLFVGARGGSPHICQVTFLHLGTVKRISELRRYVQHLHLAWARKWTQALRFWGGYGNRSATGIQCFIVWRILRCSWQPLTDLIPLFFTQKWPRGGYWRPLQNILDPPLLTTAICKIWSLFISSIFGESRQHKDAF